MESETQDVGKELARKVWVTKGARFAAHRRLSAMHGWSTAAVAILSCYLLISSIIVESTALNVSEQQRSVLSLGIIGMSMLVLVLSLLESARNYLLRAERLHDCAVALGSLEQRIEIACEIVDQPQRAASIERLAGEYHETLRRCRENHDPVDNRRFRCDYPDVFKCSWGKVFGARLAYVVRSRGVFLLAIILPPILALCLLW